MTDLTSPPPPAAAASSVQERQWGMAAHLSAFAGFLIPFGSILGPLVVWLVKPRKTSRKGEAQQAIGRGWLHRRSSCVPGRRVRP